MNYIKEQKFCKKCKNLISRGCKSGYCKKCYMTSDEYRNKMSKILTGKCGGYRKGSGRGKKGWYKGYYCDSSWELAFVIYNLEHNIKFERNTKKFEYIFEGKTLKYMPDWITDGKYVEIKGYWTKQWQAKVDQFPKTETLIILYEKEMEKYIEYVKMKYGNNFIELYDNSKYIKNIYDKKSAWFYIKNDKNNLIIEELVFKSNYNVYLSNGWTIGRYSPNIHKNFKVVKHKQIRYVTEDIKESMLRKMIDL